MTDSRRDRWCALAGLTSAQWERYSCSSSLGSGVAAASAIAVAFSVIAVAGERAGTAKGIRRFLTWPGAGMGTAVGE
jgi:hypothetical protein